MKLNKSLSSSSDIDALAALETPVAEALVLAQLLTAFSKSLV